MRPALLLVSLLLLTPSASSQETAPTSHPSGGVRYHRVEVPTPIDPARILAQAVSGDDRITVLADGAVAVTIRETPGTDDLSGEPPQTVVVHWEARLRPSQLKVVQSAAGDAKAREQPLGYDAILDLARAPGAVRFKVVVPSSLGMNWTTRHQDPDGSWSPEDFDWSCEGDKPCTMLGKESFRAAATSLILLTNLGAGYPTGGDTSPDVSARQALRWLLARQRDDGSFASASEPGAALTNACAAVALARSLVVMRKDVPPPIKSLRVVSSAIARVRLDQNPDGSWGKETDELRRISVAAWSLIALKAGETAGVGNDSAAVKRGLAWIETQTVAIEQRVIAGDSEATLSAHTRTVQAARAARAVAHVASGAEPREFSDDVTWLFNSIGSHRVPVTDAEVVLFGTLVANRCDLPLREAWMKKIRAHVIDSQHKDGCEVGTWSTPSIWSDLGGRLVGTTFLTWSLEIYYQYPMATWL